MTAKLGKVEIYNKGAPSIKFFDALTTLSIDYVTDKKRYISTSARTMANKLDRVVGSNAGLLSTKSHKRFFLLNCGHIQLGQKKLNQKKKLKMQWTHLLSKSPV